MTLWGIMGPRVHCDTAWPHETNLYILRLCEIKGPFSGHFGTKGTLVTLWDSMESMVCFDTAGPHGIMESIGTLEVMPWSGYLEQRLDKVKRIKCVFIKGLQ